MFMRNHSFWALVLGVVLVLAGTALWAGPVNINTADAITLSRELSGIGMKRAQAIVEYRQKHGPFKTADELTLVKGIGPAALEKNREVIRTAAPAALIGTQKPAANAPGRR